MKPAKVLRELPCVMRQRPAACDQVTRPPSRDPAGKRREITSTQADCVRWAYFFSLLRCFEEAFRAF